MRGVVKAIFLAVASLLAACGPSEPQDRLSVRTDFANWRERYPDAEVFRVEEGGVIYTVPRISGLEVGVRQAEEGTRYHLSFSLERDDHYSEQPLSPVLFTSELTPYFRRARERFAFIDRNANPDVRPHPIPLMQIDEACPDLSCDEAVLFGLNNCSVPRPVPPRGHWPPTNQFRYVAIIDGVVATARCDAVGEHRLQPEFTIISCTGTIEAGAYSAGYGHNELVVAQCSEMEDQIRDIVISFSGLADVLLAEN
jgi:hypothetical protein